MTPSHVVSANHGKSHFVQRMHELTTGDVDYPSSSSNNNDNVTTTTTNNNNNNDNHRQYRNSFRRCSTTRFSVLHSTASHHQALKEDEGHFVGPYAHIRETLDYTYHTYYRKERQWLQDCIIQDFLDPTSQQQLQQMFKPSSSTTTTSSTDNENNNDNAVEEHHHHHHRAQPWFIHTVGAPGAGKRHVISALVQEGKLPILSSCSSSSSRYYVHVDPQEIRRRLPEYSSYVMHHQNQNQNRQHQNQNQHDHHSQHNQNHRTCENTTTPDQVDALTGKEAGQIMELLVRAGLQAGWNVVLDGSLSDTAWYENTFYPMLQHDYPHVHLALLHITAPKSIVLKRCEEVAMWTHRHMPEERIDKILNQLPKSIQHIQPLVHFYCQIENDNEGIHVTYPTHLSWKEFTNIFRRSHQQEQEQQELNVVQPALPPQKELVEQSMKEQQQAQPAQSVKEQQQLPAEQPSSNEDKQAPELQRSPSTASSSSSSNSSCASSKSAQASIQRIFQIIASKFSKKIWFEPKLSSEQNYKAPENERGFFGQYAHIRSTLDYTYHEHYTHKRQILQDKIIDDMLNSAVVTDKNGNVCTTPTEPWLVFTAGAMGAGKSYTMNRLVETGRFPLLAFVLVDPDEIRRHLPEYHIYVDENPELAGELTNKESGFIAEILTLAGLQVGKNVLVDGSLRDAQWYKRYLARLKKEYPHVKQAIIHVTAPREAVFQRAAARAIATGRIVPKSVLEDAIDQVPRSVQLLGPQVDYFCEILNAPHAPDVQLLTEGETWSTFEQRWMQTCAWVPNKRSLLRPAQKGNTQLSVNGRRQEK